ncbi:MAG: NIL domain-containing protein [Candidatus Tectomicrobia bacterium]|uniref:NIL domain-containing protein n=1 Tax=Tectimicrobiota bacterium TaxID=2528274 RepID=A0A932LZC5_UNCTE|nr:NIL domain-containing protein [Candidatus Tectomicrobia bacterium]
MTTLRVHLRFPPEIVKRPIIHEIGHAFDIVTNIRRANITLEEGWADLEISGDSREIEKAVDTLRSWGVRVDPIEGDVIE